jgi:hypothetical protein
MPDLKCPKCSSPAYETFQRGQLITGTRCLSCNHETFAKICKTVDEVRLFLEKMYGDAKLVFQDDGASLKLEAHFVGDMDKTEQIKVWKGLEK